MTRLKKSETVREQNFLRCSVSLSRMVLLIGAGLLVGCGEDVGPLEEEIAMDDPAGVTKEIIPEAGPFSIGTGDIWFLPLAVEERSFLQAFVEQIRTDLSMTLKDASGSSLFVADSPIGLTGEEELVAILEPGEYRVEVQVNQGSPGGHFRWLGETIEPATAERVAQVDADRIHRRAWRLFKDEGAWDEALGLYRESLETWERLGLARREADTLDSMAQVYSKKKQLEVALALLDRAIGVARELDNTHDRTRLVVMLNRAGTIRLESWQRAEQAISGYFDEAVSTAETLVDQPRVKLLTYLMRGGAYRQLGALQSALDDFQRAAEIPLLNGHSRLGFSARKDTADVLLSLHHYQEALSVASAAKDFAAENGMALQALSAQGLMARAYAKRGESALALTLAQEVVEGFREGTRDLNKRSGTFELARGLQALGEIQRNSGDLSAAKESFDEALQLARDVSYRKGEAVFLLEIGNLQRLEGSPADALLTIEEALDQLRTIGDNRNVVAAMARTSEVLRDLGRLREAEESIEAALVRVESLRAATKREDIRREFFAFRQEYFDIALDILVQAWRRDPAPAALKRALELHDRRLSIELRGRWRRGAGSQVAGSPGAGPQGEEPRGKDPRETALVPGLDRRHRGEREASLERQLGQVALGESANEVSRLAELDRLLAELSELRGNQATQAGPATTGPPAVDIEAFLEDQLDSGTLALVYALGPKESYVWVLEQGQDPSLEVIPTSRSVLISLVERWTRSLTSAQPKFRNERHLLGWQLSTFLLGPVADRLAGNRLVVVAEGDLLALPFSALPDPGGSEQLLVQLAEISFLSSLAILPEIRRAEERRTREPRSVAAFVDGVFSHEDSRLSGLAPQAPSAENDRGDVRIEEAQRNIHRLSGGALSRLAYSATEGRSLLENASHIDSLTATDFVLAEGFEANLDRLRSLERNQLSILHLGTHAFIDPDRPDLSGLALSSFGPDGKPTESFLFGFEIAGWTLSADLVSLSACETARGRLIRGEGALGLSRRFLDAGAARVLSTHWRVSDQPTAQLMVKFYEFLLQGGETPPAALRKAQLRMLEVPSTKAPYYWAGFRLEGDWRRPQTW